VFATTAIVSMHPAYLKYLNELYMITRHTHTTSSPIHTHNKLTDTSSLTTTYYQTCLTAQNTKGVTAVSPTSTSDLRDQLDAVLSDIGTDSLKTGMIPSAHLAMVKHSY
jgi:Phosphomethylpyrimidine kinase